MEYAVALMAGVSYLALGLSLLLNWNDWSAWLMHIRMQGRPAALAIGALHLAIGSFIIAFHWQWKGLPMLLTFLGLKAVIEGFVYTIFPGIALAMLRWCEPHHKILLRTGGMVTILLAVIFLCE